MYKVFNLFLTALLLCLGLFESKAQEKDYTFEKELEQTVQLIVMISVDYDGESTGVGAGIVFANEKDRLLIATASHVVVKGATPAKNILVQFKSAPGKLLKATVLKHLNTGEALDLAVLSIDDLSTHGLNACAFPFDRLRGLDNLKRKDEVIPVGNPNGRSWAVPVEPDKISEITEAEIVFHSGNIKSGHSGGALIDNEANLVGMVTADEAPLGHAMTMEVLLKQLKQWKFPVRLSRSEFREARYDLPLHVAADSGNVAEIKKLLALCSNPNQVDYHFRTPLHYAASKGNVEAMSLLLKAGAVVDVQDFNQMYPLNLAVSRNHLEAVRFLLKAGAKINNETYSKLTALHLALNKDINPQIPVYLISGGADINAGDEDKNTPLHYAVQIRNLEIAKALIKAGAKIDAENSQRNTPLMIAVTSDDLQMMQLLIGAGASVKASGPEAHGVLHSAVWHSGNIETVKMLVKAGANVNEKDELGNTPLHYAISRANSERAGADKMPEFIAILLAAGADPNAKSAQGATPLSIIDNAKIDAAVTSDNLKSRMSKIGDLVRKHGGKSL